MQVYISEYLPQAVVDINVPPLWDANSTNKFEGWMLLGKDRWRKVKVNGLYFNYYLHIWILLILINT